MPINQQSKLSIYILCTDSTVNCYTFGCCLLYLFIDIANFDICLFLCDICLTVIAVSAGCVLRMKCQQVLILHSLLLRAFIIPSTTLSFNYKQENPDKSKHAHLTPNVFPSSELRI